MRIRKNTSAYTVDADDFTIGALTYVFQDSDDEATGTFWYSLECARFTTYS